MTSLGMLKFEHRGPDRYDPHAGRPRPLLFKVIPRLDGTYDVKHGWWWLDASKVNCATLADARNLLQAHVDFTDIDLAVFDTWAERTADDIKHVRVEFAEALFNDIQREKGLGDWFCVPFPE